jgi:hypothetical protein
MHKIATQPDGSLSKEGLEYLHMHPPVARLRDIDLNHGKYFGSILWADDRYAVQSLGHGDICIHDARNWEELPSVNDRVAVCYRDGKLSIIIESPERDRGDPSFSM